MKDTKITAGVLDDAQSLFRKLGDLFANGLDRLIDLGLSVREDTEKNKEEEKKAKEQQQPAGNKSAQQRQPNKSGKDESAAKEITRFFIVDTIDPDDDSKVEVQMAVKALDKTGTRFDLTFTFPNGKTITKENIRQAQLDDTILKALESEGYYDFENYGEIELSTNIRATLRKITSSDEVSVELVAIQAGSNPVGALAVIKEITENPEFVAALSDQPTTFMIQDDGSDYDVTECDCIDTSASYACMLQEALRTLSVVQTVHWNSKGEDFYTIHNLTDQFIWKLREQVDALAEMCVEFNGCVASPIDLVAELDSEIDGCVKFTAEQGFEVVKTHLDKLIDTYSALYCNCPADVQSELDSWIREWKKESQYKLASALS